MLDENLPTFFLKPSSDNDLQSTIFYGQGGHDLKPEYTLKRPDPKLPASRNCYAIALYDSYNPEVLFAEVLVSPEWTQPTLSQAEIRAQNGVPPPPVPLVPSEFAIQLYNPDQQVKVRQIEGKWASSAYWEFEMPQQTFRMPSASSLDRTQDDPAALDITPKVNFKWKRDGKLSKNISCTLAGKTTNSKKSKEPDITLAMFKHGKELTIYEPNMGRVDVEDTKGLEVVMILGALVIRDIFFEASREMFNISGPPPPTVRKNSNPVIGGKTSTTTAHNPAIMTGALSTSPPARIPNSQIPPPPPTGQRPNPSSRPPPADPHTQWAIDAETARLQAEVAAEEKARKAAEKAEEKRVRKMIEHEEREARRKEAEAQKVEELRLRRMVEEEERAAQRREAEIAKETERLRKQYGVPGSPHVQFAPQMPPRPGPQQAQSGHGRTHSASGSGAGVQGGASLPYRPSAPGVPRPMSTGATLNGPFSDAPNTFALPPVRPQGGSGSGSGSSPYLQAPGQQGSASTSGFFGLGGKKVQKKRSVFF